MFIEYAVSERAKELFAVTGDWWSHPGAVTIRYEDLVRDPVGELRRLVVEFSRDSPPNLPQIVASYGVAELRRNSFNNHIWKGVPGHWRDFLPAELANRIAEAHAEYFRLLGYTCDADPALTDTQADSNWVASNGPSLRAALSRAAASHVVERESQRAGREALVAERESLLAEGAALRNERETFLSEGAALRAEIEVLRLEKDRLAQLLDAATIDAAHQRARLEPFENLQGFSIRIARVVQRVRDRVVNRPKLSRPTIPPIRIPHADRL